MSDTKLSDSVMSGGAAGDAAASAAELDSVASSGAVKAKSSDNSGAADAKSSATKRAFSADTDVSFRTHIGGQALIEGIMMRGRYNWAVAVRTPEGAIYTEAHDLKHARKKDSWLSWPIIRGCVAFVDSLVLGYKALSISADHAYDLSDEGDEGIEGDEDLPAKQDNNVGEHPAANDGEHPVSGADNGEHQEGLGGWIVVSLVLGLILGIAAFVVLPAWLSNLVFGAQAMNDVSWNLFDGLVRVVIFIAYIAAIGQMRDIKRMFCYHGAEHKTIHAFEHGAQLTPKNCMDYPRLHVRCGTAFLIMVMIIAIFVYTALGKPINALVDLTGVLDGPLRFILIMLTRIILMPLIAGISYEISVKWAGNNPDKALVKILLWPGLQMQRLTTKEPDESMLECAIEATNLVIAKEKEMQEEEAREKVLAQVKAQQGAAVSA